MLKLVDREWERGTEGGWIGQRRGKEPCATKENVRKEKVRSCGGQVR